MAVTYLSFVPAVPPDIVYGGDTSADLAVAEGDNATLSCRATGRPPPRVSWRREDGEPIIIRASTAGACAERGDQTTSQWYLIMTRGTLKARALIITAVTALIINRTIERGTAG